MPTADSSQLVAMIKAAAPFYQMFGKAEVKLLQNVDDPAKFVQIIDIRGARGLGAQPAAHRRAIRACRSICRPGARCFPARWRSTFSRKFDRAVTEGSLRPSADARASPLGRHIAFHLQLGFQAREIAEYRGDGKHPPIAPVSQQTIPCLDIAVDRDFIPLLGMADIIDRHIVVLAPEERHRVESSRCPSMFRAATCP